MKMRNSFNIFSFANPIEKINICFLDLDPLNPFSKLQATELPAIAVAQGFHMETVGYVLINFQELQGRFHVVLL